MVGLRVFKEKNTDKTAAYNALSEEVDSLRDKLAEQQALVTRLRQEGDKSSHNHAMRTALLATTESELEQARADMEDKDRVIQERNVRIAALERDAQHRMESAQRSSEEHERQLEALREEAEDAKVGAESRIAQLAADHAAEVDRVQKEYVSCYTIVLSLFLFVPVALSLTHLSIYCCLPAFSDTT